MKRYIIGVALSVFIVFSSGCTGAKDTADAQKPDGAVNVNGYVKLLTQDREYVQ